MAEKNRKERLDLILTERGFYRSRSQAKRAIMAGEVRVDNEVIDKAGTKIRRDADIEIKEKPPFVSRGGKKLQKALDKFGIEVSSKLALDIGSSTGGFTDCLLQAGARQVYAVDSGTNQLVWKLRKDDRVEVLEQTKFHELKPGDLPDNFEVVTADVSFISLTLILPVAVNFLSPGADVIVLIKPQFEAGPELVGKGGVVKDPATQMMVIEKILKKFLELNITPENLDYSPISGASSGNREFLLQGIYRPREIIEQTEGETELESWRQRIRETVYAARDRLERS